MIYAEVHLFETKLTSAKLIFTPDPAEYNTTLST